MPRRKAAGINYFALDRTQPYAQRWSLGLQRQFKAGFVLEASYVGNRGTRIGVSRNINGTPLNYLSTSPTRDQPTITYLGAAFPNPFYGLDPLYTSSTISREQMLRPYPEFGSITFTDPVGYSWYHSLQSRLEKRLAHGFTLQTSYTWSKAMEASSFLNAADPMPNRSLADIDRAQRIAGSGIYEFPFGRGRRFGAHLHPLLEFFAGGWQLSGAMQRQSGQPIGWGQMLFSGDSKQLVLPSSQRNADRWFNTGIFNRASNVQPASNVRTFPLRFSNVRMDSQRRWDFSLNKSLPAERARQVRLPRRDVQRAERAGAAGSEHQPDLGLLRHHHRPGAAALLPVLAADGVLKAGPASTLRSPGGRRLRIEAEFLVRIGPHFLEGRLGARVRIGDDHGTDPHVPSIGHLVRSKLGAVLRGLDDGHYRMEARA